MTADPHLGRTRTTFRRSLGMLGFWWSLAAGSRQDAQARVSLALDGADVIGTGSVSGESDPTSAGPALVARKVRPQYCARRILGAYHRAIVGGVFGPSSSGPRDKTPLAGAPAKISGPALAATAAAASAALGWRTSVRFESSR
jgi:hypothetical protein